MRYIALLRGVNVGGNNKISMKELKECFEQAGYQNVSTYINSGNVLFDSAEGERLTLIKKCEDIIRERFGFPVGLTVIAAPALKDALGHAPAWWDFDPEAKHNAIFVIPPATAEEIITEVGKAKPEYEQVDHYKELIFWSAPLETFSRTRWSKIVGSRAYKSVTIRNAKTAKKLLELALR